jgi:hypothetical protein
MPSRLDNLVCSGASKSRRAYSTLMFGRLRKAAWNFSFTTWPEPAAMAALAAAWSSLTVASEAPQDWQVTMDELFASLGVTNAPLPQFAQVSMLGEFMLAYDPI